MLTINSVKLFPSPTRICPNDLRPNNMIKIHNRLGKVSALAAVTLMLPALAYADRDHDRGNNRDNDDHEQRGGNRDRNDHIPVVPEATAGWVLIPFVGAVLLFSARHLFRGKVTE
jgi:hypothetical protein